MSETDNLIDTMAKMIVGTVDDRLSSADFDKSSQGVVTAKAGDTYTIAVFGGNYNITTDQTFVVGQKVLVTAPQGNMKNLTVSPGNIGTMKTVRSGVQDVDNRLSDIEGDYNFAYDIIKKQTDGELTIWYNTGEPTVKGYPAYQWTTDDAKKGHIGDMYFDTKNNVAWQWEYKNNTYQWVKVSDSTITATLLKSSKAQDTADGKRRVFYGDANNPPSPPYDVGDIWSQGKNGDILRCTKAKNIMGSYSRNDWVEASKYTDDTVANEAKEAAKNAQGTADNITNVYKEFYDSEFTVEKGHISALVGSVTKGLKYGNEETIMMQNSSRLDQTDTAIKACVKEEDFTKADSAHSSVVKESIINVTKDQINLAVKENGVIGSQLKITNNNIESKVSKDGVISAINQTADTATINANRINFNGLVTFENDKAVGFNPDAVNKSVTFISGDAIKTGTLKADKIEAGTITAKQFANGAIFNLLWSNSDYENKTFSGSVVLDDKESYNMFLLEFRGTTKSNTSSEQYFVKQTCLVPNTVYGQYSVQSFYPQANMQDKSWFSDDKKIQMTSTGYRFAMRAFVFFADLASLLKGESPNYTFYFTDAYGVKVNPLDTSKATLVQEKNNRLLVPIAIYGIK